MQAGGEALGWGSFCFCWRSPHASFSAAQLFTLQTGFGIRTTAHKHDGLMRKPRQRCQPSLHPSNLRPPPLQLTTSR